MAEQKPPQSPQEQAGKQGNPPPASTRWQKGQSGNPGGRAKGKSLLAEIRQVLDEDHLLGKPNRDGKTNRRLLAEAAIRHAQAGRSAYFKLIMEYLFGKPVIRIEQKTEVSGSTSQLTDEQASALMAWVDENLKEPQE